MNGNRFLLDTNIILYLIANRVNINNLPDGEFLISFITELELLSYPSISKIDEEKIKKFLKEIPIINIDQNIKNKTIEFRKKYKLKLPDAIIAATTFEFNVILITNDETIKTVKEIYVKSVDLKNN